MTIFFWGVIISVLIYAENENGALVNVKLFCVLFLRHYGNTV